MITSVQYPFCKGGGTISSPCPCFTVLPHERWLDDEVWDRTFSENYVRVVDRAKKRDEFVLVALHGGEVCRTAVWAEFRSFEAEAHRAWAVWLGWQDWEDSLPSLPPFVQASADDCLVHAGRHYELFTRAEGAGYTIARFAELVPAARKYTCAAGTHVRTWGEWCSSDVCRDCEIPGQNRGRGETNDGCQIANNLHH